MLCLIGAILFGLVGDRFSIKAVLPVSTALYVLFIALIFFIDTSNLNMIYLFFGFIGFVDGGYEATQMRIGMDFSHRVLAGTAFNLYNSLSNIGQIAVGSVLIAIIANFVGFKVAWQLSSVFLILALLIAYKIFNENIDELQSLKLN